MLVPSLLLKQLYTFGSLKNTETGVMFSLKNRLSDATITDIHHIAIDGIIADLEETHLILEDGKKLKPEAVSSKKPIDFPLKSILDIHVPMEALPEGKYKLEVKFSAKPFGKLTLKVDTAIERKDENRTVIPRDRVDDYSETAIKTRQAFVEKVTGKKLEHIPHYSFDPHIAEGNCEHFVGVAQVPMGFAGPITVHGEHAQGDFIIPMATAEGTLVASYNRGMKLLNACGGAKVSVVDDVMQRAPVFVMEDARAARDFIKWVKAHEREIAAQAEATTSVGKLRDIDCYQAIKFAYLRFNYTTGDAAGQNMVGRATLQPVAGCETYHEHRFEHFYLRIQPGY
ncbi:MAG: hypothetical protein R3B47_10520 [Bacteroidia bacterium]